MKKIKVLVAYHKKSPIVKDNVFYPIHVGKELSSIDLNIQGDNTGDNISHKNPIYCEMSAVYWAWKNMDADYYGLCHYRRIFTLENISFIQQIKEFSKYWAYRLIGNIVLPGVRYSRSGIISITSEELYKEKAYKFSKQIMKMLEEENIDIILPKPWDSSCNNNSQQFFSLGKNFFLLLNDIVKELFPDLFPFLLKVYSNHKLHAANMFIMKKVLFDQYCTKMFSILEEHEKRAVCLGYCNDVLKDKTYSRLSGYLAELLTNAIVLKFIEDGCKMKTFRTMFLS